MPNDSLRKLAEQLQRYTFDMEIDDDGNERGYMEHDKEGQYVLYEDVLKLLASHLRPQARKCGHDDYVWGCFDCHAEIYRPSEPQAGSERDAIELLVAVRDSAVTDSGHCSICLLDPHSPGCVIELVEKFITKIEDEAESAPSLKGKSKNGARLP